LKLAALLILASFPFVGALVLGWLGQSRSWAARYRRARERTAALADEVDEMTERLEAADARLQESQRRLRGDGGDP
jgi:hypothetical protein